MCEKKYAVALIMTEWDSDGIFGQVVNNLNLFTSNNSHEVIDYYSNLTKILSNRLEDPNTKYDISLVAGFPDNVSTGEELGEFIISGHDDLESANNKFIIILKQLKIESS